MSVSILRIWSLWLVRKNMRSWRMDHLPSLSIPGCWVAELKIKRWRRFCQVGTRHYSSFQKREREFCGFLTKYVKVPRPQILADLHTWRGVDVRQQTVSDWMKLADFTSDSGIDRRVYLHICTHLPSKPLVSFFVDYFSIFLKNWW